MKIIRVVLCCVAAAALSAQAQKVCSKGDSAAAEKAIDRVVSWPSLQKAYVDYRHCDTGPVDELYTDALLRLMVEWKNVDSVAGAVAADAEYKAWIHKHLLSPAAADDRESVYSRAKASCPAKQAAFCAEIAEVTKPGKDGPSPNAPLNFDSIKPIKPVK